MKVGEWVDTIFLFPKCSESVMMTECDRKSESGNETEKRKVVLRYERGRIP